MHVHIKFRLLIFAALSILTVTGQTTITMVDFSHLEKLTQQYPDSAFVKLKAYMAIARSREDVQAEAQCLEQMGQVLYHMGNYRFAMDHLLASEKIARKENLTEQLASTLNTLGTVCYYNQQTQKAAGYFNEAKVLYARLGHKSGLAKTLGLIGQLHEKKLDLDSAAYFQRLALQEGLAAKDTAVIAKIYENMGSIMEDRNQLDSARYYFEASLGLNKSLGNFIAQIEVINNLGDVCRKSGRIREGLVFSREARDLAIVLQEKYQLNSAYRDLAKSYQMLGQMDSAYQYIELSRALMQEIYAEDNVKQIALMQTLFDTERKNVEITQLNSERKINLTIAFAAIFGLVLLSLLAAVIFSRQKLRLKNQAAVHQHEEEIHIARHTLTAAELKHKELAETALKQQLELKSKALSSHLLHLIQKNEVLEELKSGLAEIIKDDKRDQKKQLRLLLQKINFSFSQDQYWEEFRHTFDQVHQSFFESLRQICPELSPTETRLLSLIKMNLGSSDIATLLGITQDSLRVTRYRVKKKLQLKAEDSLAAYIGSI